MVSDLQNSLNILYSSNRLTASLRLSLRMFCLLDFMWRVLFIGLVPAPFEAAIGWGLLVAIAGDYSGNLVGSIKSPLKTWEGFITTWRSVFHQGSVKFWTKWIYSVTCQWVLVVRPHMDDLGTRLGSIINIKAKLAGLSARLRRFRDATWVWRPATVTFVPNRHAAWVRTQSNCITIMGTAASAL